MHGEQDALTTLVERHHRPLLGYLYRMLDGNRVLAEDFVQETFVRVLQQTSYQGGRPFKPWLYAIASNLVLDYFRSGHVHHAVFDEKVLDTVYDPTPSPEERLLIAEEERVVRAALGQLGAEYRAVLILRFYNDMSLQEIADSLAIPLGTVKSRLSVGTRRLRQMLSVVKEALPQ